MFIRTFLSVCTMLLLLLDTPGSFAEPVLSLWGKAADFSAGCSHWTLKPRVSIPALDEFSACLIVKLQVQSSDPMTVFMYRHPEMQCAELGLGKRDDRFVVWLFGREWTSPNLNLQVKQWYSLCLSWSNTNDRPVLYIDGNAINITEVHYPNTPPFKSALPGKLAPNGSLTLGAGHTVHNGDVHVIPHSTFLGTVSLFRMWQRERSHQEVMSLNCTEGDLVKLDHNDWTYCTPLAESSLKCEWSIYEVNLQFVIIRIDKNTTELYVARDIAHRWLRKVLPNSIYLHRVSVFEVTSFRTQNNIKTSSEHRQMRWAPSNINRFQCLVHVSVIPSMDVAKVQQKMYTDLSVGYTDPSGLLELLANTDSINTTPVESFSTTTISPASTATDSVPVTTPDFTSAAVHSSSASTVTSTVTSTATSTSVKDVTTVIAPRTSAANASELYFEVKMNVSITGEYDPEEILPKWLNSSLPDDLMMVLDLQVLPKNERRPEQKKNYSYIVIKYRGSRESLIFQVQILTLLSDPQEMKQRIEHYLLMPYNNGSISIETEHIEIFTILSIQCDGETQQTLKGQFVWPDTSGGKNATCACPKNPGRAATRHCKLSQFTHWMDPDLQECPPVVESIPDLVHIQITPDNALEVLERIEELLSNQSTLVYSELDTVLDKLKDIISVSVVTPAFGQTVINIISDILGSDSDLAHFTNTILNLTEAVGDKMVGYEGSYTITAQALAVSVVDVHPEEFGSLTFGVLSDLTGTKPEIFVNRYPFNDTVAFISLPSALQNSFPHHQNSPRIQFQFYGNPLLFKRGQKEILNTFVVSASVTNASSPIQNLPEDVKVMLHHLQPNTLNNEVQCVYWNFNKNNGHGGWDDHGCRKHNSSSDYTTCLCDHLTHFGVLLDPSRAQLDPVNEQILTIITYVGCGVSSLFLGITLLTYVAFEKLRRDYPSRILINLALALLGLNLLFLINSWLSSWELYGLCVAAAALLHYFLLAAFTWMGLEAVNMYFALVKVFNVYVPSYILKFCALGWGIPLVVCVTILIVNRDAYGSQLYTQSRSTFGPLENTESFCWLQDDITFYVSVVAYAALILIFNIGVFVVVLIQIRHMRVNSPAGTRRGVLQDLKGVASLTFLLGLTWTFGFFAWGPGRIALLYLFSGLNTMQGVFVFLFHCLMKENVRKQWRRRFCCGRFRLEEHSDWSNSASVRVPTKPKEKFPKAVVPSVGSVRSNSTDSTSASSDSSQRDSSCRRPDLCLFVSNLVLPRAQMGASDTPTLASSSVTNAGLGWNYQLKNQSRE